MYKNPTKIQDIAFKRVQTDVEDQQKQIEAFLASGGVVKDMDKGQKTSTLTHLRDKKSVVLKQARSKKPIDKKIQSLIRYLQTSGASISKKEIVSRFSIASSEIDFKIMNVNRRMGRTLIQRTPMLDDVGRYQIMYYLVDDKVKNE